MIKLFESKNFFRTALGLVFFASLLSTVSLFSQPITWTAVYGGIHYDRGKGIVQTADKGFMICSSSSSYGAGSSDIYLLKIDSVGKYQWQTTIGGVNIESAYSIKQTPDSGFVISGSTNSFGAGGYDAYLIKTNSLGALQWQKTFGGSDWDFSYWAEPTNDGGFILAGESYTADNNTQASLIKTNSAGDTLWTKLLGVQGADGFKEVHQTADSGFIAAGTSTTDAGDMDFYLVKTNAAGVVLWEKTFGTTADDICNSVAVCSDGRLLLGGHSVVTGKNAYHFMITTSNGTPIKDTIMDLPPTNNKSVSHIRETIDGNIVLLINSDAGGLGGREIFMVNYHVSLNWFQWVRTFGGAYDEEAYDFIQTSDSGFALVGYTDTYSIGPDNNIFIVKTDKDANYNSSANNYVSMDELLQKNESVFIFPNPTSGKFKIENPDLKAESITIYNLTGELVFESRKAGFSEFDISSLINGVYFIEIKTNTGVVRKKIILSK